MSFSRRQPDELDDERLARRDVERAGGGNEDVGMILAHAPPRGDGFLRGGDGGLLLGLRRLARQPGLVVGGHGPDHPRSPQLRDLAEQQADPAGRGVHQDGLALAGGAPQALATTATS